MNEAAHRKAPNVTAAGPHSLLLATPAGGSSGPYASGVTELDARLALFKAFVGLDEVPALARRRGVYHSVR